MRRQWKTGRFPPTLILGETGVGKRQLARAIHDARPRATRPFVEAGCGGIPSMILEAELFGFERGAFPDVRDAKAGLLQAAHGGTLLVSSIGLLPEILQAKLLRVPEEETVQRPDGTRSEPVDVSVISTSDTYLNWGLGTRAQQKDLLRRLAVVTIPLPPLRERGHAILTLARYYLARYCAEYGSNPKTFTEDARAALLAYRWPGNVRELYNVMERVVVLFGEASRVTPEMLGLRALQQTR